MKKLLLIFGIIVPSLSFSQTKEVVKKYENGTIKERGFITNELRDSSWTSYYEDGTVKYIAHYDNGVKVGNWKTYHKNGNTMFSILYVDGNKKEGLQYNESGELIDKKTY